jgi:hypothetical protein
MTMETFFSHALMIIAKMPERVDVKTQEKEIAETAIDGQRSERPFLSVEQ